MIYFGCFLLSVLCCAIALQNQRSRMKYRFFIFLSVLFPVLLAGLRATSVGTDVEYYLVNDFRVAGLRSSFIQYITSYVSSREPLYMLIVYIVKKTTNNLNHVLFLFQLVVIGGVYRGLFKHKDTINVPFAMFLFLLLIYNETLNLMRQWMALSILFAGVDQVEKRRYGHFIPYVIVAALLHTSALLGFVLIPMHYILYHELHGQRTIIKLFFMMAVAAVCLLASQLIRLLTTMGILNSRYLSYVNRSSISGRNIDTVLVLGEIALLLIFNRRLNRRVVHHTFYKYNTYLYLLVMQLARVMYYGDRFAGVFRLMNIMTLAGLPSFANSRRERQVVQAGVMIVCIVYWWYMYIYTGNNATYPYVFA